MSTIQTTHQTHRDFRQHTVAVADSIAGPWTELEHTYCDRLSLVASGIDAAVLSYHPGHLIQPGRNSFGIYPLAEIRRKLVRITLDQGPGQEDFVWYGFIAAEQQSRDGAHLFSGGSRLLGGDVQVWTAVGLEWFLDRSQITTAQIYDSTSVTFANLEIQRGLTFNASSDNLQEPSTTSIGNRHIIKSLDGNEHVFAETLDSSSQLWSGDQIVSHVLTYHAAKRLGAGVWPVRWALTNRDALSWFTPEVPTDGRTPLQVINDVINRRRGLGWRLDVNATAGTATVVPFTYTDSPVSLPSGSTLPANTSTVELDFDRAIDITTAELAFQEARQYDRVRCRGARRGSCFTVSAADGTLEEDAWSHLLSDYQGGAVFEDGYNDLSTQQKKRRNDEYRRAERFVRVARCFRIPADWDGKAASGDGLTSGESAFPVFDEDGAILAGQVEPLWHAGLRLMPELPLKTDHDYSSSPPTQTVPSGTLPEFRPAFVLFEIDAENERYQYGDQLDNLGENGDDGRLTASYYLRMQQTSLGFELRAAGGMAHLLLDNDQDWPSGTEPTQYEPELDWRKARATVFCEHNSHAEAVWPTSGWQTTRALEELVIDIGQRARLDYLVPNTVFDIEDGEPLLAAGQFLRDDRDLLRDVARMAFLWYSTERAAFQLTYRQLTKLFHLGDFITQIGHGNTQQTVGTVISSIDFDFNRGTTTVRTDFAELDFTEFLPL